MQARSIYRIISTSRGLASVVVLLPWQAGGQCCLSMDRYWLIRNGGVVRASVHRGWCDPCPAPCPWNLVMDQSRRSVACLHRSVEHSSAFAPNIVRYKLMGHQPTSLLAAHENGDGVAELANLADLADLAAAPGGDAGDPGSGLPRPQALNVAPKAASNLLLTRMIDRIHAVRSHQSYGRRG